MKKKTVSAARPQPAQIQAIERCIERGDLDEAERRLLRLEADFPNFKPLKRLAFEIAVEGGRVPEIAAKAWDWCEASSGSATAFGALFDICDGEYPYLFLHAAERLCALGESVPEEVWKVRESLDESLGEQEGLRLDLSRVFMSVGKIEEARALIETLDYPAARNNFAQVLFAEGDIGQAVEVLESVLAKNPVDAFALYRLAALYLWLSGKTAAKEPYERLLATVPVRLDELSRQMESALLFGEVARADEIYRSAPDFPWYEKAREYDPEPLDALHHLGAMAAWRLGNRSETIQRLNEISEDDDKYDDIHRQCFSASIDDDTPDWALGTLSQWWPMTRIMSLGSEILHDNAVFENWRVPMPHGDYLIAVASSGGRVARAMALAALRYLAEQGGEFREEAKRVMLILLRLPCGPDSVRGDLHTMLADYDLFDGEKPVKIFLGGELTETQPFTLKITDGMTQKEAVFDEADGKRYERVLDYLADDDLPHALELLEGLLERYPDYPRILTAVAAIRQANDEPLERWAPLVRRAVEIAPDYFFSRIGQARLLAAENRIEEAKETLKPLHALKEMHRSEWRALIGAQIAIAQAEDDFPALARLNRALQNFDRSREQNGPFRRSAAPVPRGNRRAE
jgi:tetratricopeptide (TPR) repeat protein